MTVLLSHAVQGVAHLSPQIEHQRAASAGCFIGHVLKVTKSIRFSAVSYGWTFSRLNEREYQNTRYQRQLLRDKGPRSDKDEDKRAYSVSSQSKTGQDATCEASAGVDGLKDGNRRVQSWSGPATWRAKPSAFISRDIRPIQSRGQRPLGAYGAWSRCQTLPVENFQETVFRHQPAQHSHPTKRGHLLILDSSGTTSRGSPLGSVQRWGCHLKSSDGASSTQTPRMLQQQLPKEMCIYSLTPLRPPFSRHLQRTCQGCRRATVCLPLT